MSSVFCTIITGDYIFYALAMRDSLCVFDPTAQLHVLVADGTNPGIDARMDTHNIKFHTPDLICTSGVGRELHAKYHAHAMDRFRWSMKPVFMDYLFRQERAEKVIYVDCDIYFFNDYRFLFQELGPGNILLSPHWRSSNPVVDAANFEKNLTEGLFNGGFLGATTEASHILDWWARACLYKCEQNRERGLYDDQKYLDMMPAFFDGVKILRHRGCNVGEWNPVECKRVLTESGQVMINNEHPIIFVHFTSWLYHRVLIENDILLKPYLDIQVAALRKYKPDFQPPMPKIPPLPPTLPIQKRILNKLRRGARRLTARN
jgi:hypothetical protein